MGDTGGSVTLIFYKIDRPWNEPLLNLIAAAAQLSPFTHVEIAIGSRVPAAHAVDSARERNSCAARRAGNEYGQLGQMSNVARIFNDEKGVPRSAARGPTHPGGGATPRPRSRRWS